MSISFIVNQWELLERLATLEGFSVEVLGEMQELSKKDREVKVGKKILGNS